MEKTFIRGELSECCKNPDNLEDQLTGRKDLRIKKCRICGRNHYRFHAEMGIFGILMKK